MVNSGIHDAPSLFLSLTPPCAAYHNSEMASLPESHSPDMPSPIDLYNHVTVEDVPESP
ncbi:hypothetical protein DSO57_1028719 [Entomophthora muscae]|uniref:Uncharacterized protein n=1 Tax=Entomophthora muscae TaxID=34485 RepID=A0ACC2UAC4_9FUNG|nr:hypothetical protein DSO57_1028719 [Entomophthora muscae]